MITRINQEQDKFLQILYNKMKEKVQIFGSFIHTRDGHCNTQIQNYKPLCFNGDFITSYLSLQQEKKVILIIKIIVYHCKYKIIVNFNY